MEAVSDKTPLLVNIEEDVAQRDFRDPRDKIRDLYLTESSLGFLPTGERDPDYVNISASNSVSDLREPKQDHIVAIFVVAFDTRSGNIVEWSLPEDSDLRGIEFKSMASGSHNIHSDFIYFRKGDLFGLSCFENMPVDSQVERGARMKSVGILATSYTLLYRHMQFLETQVRHQLEVPGRYRQLAAFYNDRKGSLTAKDSSGSSSTTSGSTPNTTPGIEELPDMKITHPAGCFSQFIKFFGENIFVIWKYVLLQKRIFFFSPPPIGVVCYRVYCACLLGTHKIMQIAGKDPRPFFYVNIADIDSLEGEESYIACTTEKIFEEKKQLYDVYIDNQNIKAHCSNMKELQKINASDKDKFTKLNNHRSAHLFLRQERGLDSEEMDEDHIFAMFFLEQNNRLFQTLLDISLTSDRMLTSDHMKSMGLDPVDDRQFLMDLVELYGVDVVLMVDNPCCPV